MTNELIIKYYKFDKNASDLKFDIHNGGVDLEFSLPIFLENEMCQNHINDVVKAHACGFYYTETTLSLYVKNSPLHITVPSPYALNPPPGLHMLVVGRSGNYFKKNIDVFKGLIDSSYRGMLMIGLYIYSSSTKLVEIQHKSKIAQLVFLNYIGADLRNLVFEEVDSLEELESSERGTRGFGSTGL